MADEIDERAKDVLRGELAKLKDRLQAGQKQAAAAMRAEAAGLARAVADKAKASGERVVVAQLDLGGDRAALEQAVKTIRDVCPDAADRSKNV